MKKFTVALAVISFAVALAALTGWLADPASEVGLYDLCFFVLTFVTGCLLLQIRR